MSKDLQTIQTSLLAGRWEHQADDSASSLPVQLAKDVVNGAFRDALTSARSRQLFSVNQTDLLDQPLSKWFTHTRRSQDPSAEDELVQLILGVACLQSFVQANWTGPDLDFKVLDVVTSPSENIDYDSLHSKVISELAYGGEPAYHLAEAPELLWLAKSLLDLPYKYCASAAWWRLRAWSIHLHVLDEPVAPPPEISASVEPLIQQYASHPDLAGGIILEQGLLDHLLGNDRSAAQHFVRAAQTLGLEYELTGALGKRTKFQQNDVTQLVLLAQSRDRDGDVAEAKKDLEPGINAIGTNNSVHHIPETLALNDDTLLEETQFTSSSTPSAGSRLAHLDPSSQPALHPLDQCILLSLCLNVSNTSPSHGLTAEQMSPYVARVISHPRNWTVHTMALLLRSRLECNRTRTVERSTLQLQALVDQMPTSDSPVTERLLYVYSMPLPSKWEMQKELATRFLSIGVVKSALEIFERLEMWEDVVKCWASMERRDKGIAIVRDLLEGKIAEADAVIARGKSTTDRRRHALDAAREAKLWCILGDLEPENALSHYTKAWEVSGQTSGRAMRSLGGYYFARGDYPNTITCLRRATAINPLLARSWFILGCAYVRQEDWEGAREAFIRCVTIDDEDGESWNNLASVYLRMGEAVKTRAQIAEQESSDDDDRSPRGLIEGGEKIPFTNKMLAFRALKQGLKYKYENWRMWTNYMIVAMDVGELSEACRALTRVVEERSDKDGAACVDEDVVERLVDAVTRAPADADEAVEGDGTARNAAQNPNEGHGLLRRVTDLFERTLLPRVSSTRIFRAWARLLTWQGRWEEALTAYLDAYRSGLAGTMESGETDLQKWREAVTEVEEIVDVLRNFGPRVEETKWKSQARSIVRTFMGRTKDFADEPEWARLVELQEELRKAD